MMARKIVITEEELRMKSWTKLMRLVSERRNQALGSTAAERRAQWFRERARYMWANDPKKRQAVQASITEGRRRGRKRTPEQQATYDRLQERARKRARQA